MLRNMKADNDDEPLSFVLLAALTANVTRFLISNEKQDSENGDETSRREGAEQHEAYVAERLRNVEAFERRARGIENGALRKRR